MSELSPQQNGCNINPRIKDLDRRSRREIQSNFRITDDLIRDVREQLARIGHLRWSESRPTVNGHGWIAVGPSSRGIQSWRASEAGRTFERRAAR